MKIKEIKTRVIYNTRGEETLEVDLITDDGFIAFASAPSGKSKSSKEPKYVEVGSERLGVREIVGVLEKIDIENPSEFDEIILKIDGTADKSRLGVNLILPISIAFRRLLAFKKKIPLWQVLSEEILAIGGFVADEEIKKSPIFLFNMLNGGAHSKNNLSFQEYLVVVDEKNSRKNLETGLVIYKKVKNLYPNAGLGDENGFSFNFENSTKPFEVLQDIIQELNVSENVKLGVDAAATSFYSDGKYHFDEKISSRDEFAGVYDYIINKFGISYLEDPFYEEDFEGFAKLNEKSKKNFNFSTFPQCVIIGDDLTSTNANLIKQAISQKSISGVIIKPNQIGTVKETLDAVKIAKENNIKIIVSHRSGETDDNFICHLAKAVGAWAVKFGAPAKDRIFKYNEIMRITE